MKKYVVIGASLLGLALVGAGCAETEDLEKASDDLSDMTGENDRNYKAAMRKVHIGDEKAKVIALLGKPRDKQTMRSEYGKTEMLYYGSWQLSLEDGSVRSNEPLLGG